MEMVQKYETNLPRLHHTVSIFDYWVKKIDSSYHIKDLLELQFVALTILAIPTAQVACERNFSDLNFVFSSKRTRIDPKLLESILFLRTNRELYDEIKKEDLDKIKNE